MGVYNTGGHGENINGVDEAIDDYSTSISNNQAGDTNQNINIVDIICEGPVKGLVSGKAGVYFNDVSAEYAEYAEFTPTIADNYGTITFDGSTTVGGASIGTFSSEITIPDILGNGENSYRTLVLIDYLETPVTVSRVSGSEYLWVATATSGTPFAPSGSFNWNNEEVQYDKTRFSIYRTGDDGSIEVYSIGRDSSNNTTTFTFSLNSRYELDTNATYTIRKSRLYPIAETFGTSTTIHVTGNPPAGTYSFRITEVDTEQTLADRISGRAGGSKIDNLTIQSRNGELGQDPVEEVEGVGGTVAIPGDVRLVNLPTLKLISADAADTLNVARIDAAGMPLINGVASDDFNDDATILTSSSFNLSTTQIPQTDQLRWSIRYSALQTLSLTGGSRRHAYAYYVMEARFKKDASSAFEDWVTCFPKQSTSEDYIIHNGRTNAPVNFDHIMNLEQYKPFVDFEIRIIRVNRHVGLPIEADGTSAGKSNRESWQIAATGNLTNLTAYIKDKFNYPYTALVSSSFSSKQFNSVPKRSYLMEGLFVKVPSNYTPREYSTTLDSSNNPKAVYDGLWDGSFKLRYTDNPAWVFYDIVTNNRYGAGRWISENDIDKYALYRIARYCDDLVDDGKGGVEPRFRANIFLTKATDVYKVLKDMATVFLGILYWQDGKLTPVQDAPQDPVYAFSKANVIDGKFAYESTGSRTRVNQVVVTWNDPTVNYEPVPVIVEDRDSIAKTGRIISQNSVAFGATSEGQAIRYGRWKLWTAQNQTEIVNFKTSIAGHYVKPGDVITIQDADRYGLQYSGRIKSYTAAVANTSPASITVDRQISYNAGASYTLNTVVTSAAAFWTGTSTLSISGEDPVQSGGLVKRAYVPGEGGQPVLIDTEDKASNAFRDSAFQNPIALVWRPYTYVQQTSVTNNSGTASNVITLSGADTEFDVVPTAGTVWSLTETVTNAELFEQQGNEIRTLGASKEYRVLSLTEDSKSEISISAVEHFNSKYNIVENGYDVAIFTSSQPVEQGDQFVPPPRNLRVEIDSNNVNPGDSIVIEWDGPLSTEENANLVSKYELYHNVSGLTSPLVVSDSRYEFDLVPEGTLEVQVRSLTAKGNRSVLKALRYFVQDFDKNITRVQEGIPKGIFSSTTILINDNEQLQFELSPTAVVSIGDELDDARSIDFDDTITLTSIKDTPDVKYSVFLNDSTLQLTYFETEALEDLTYWRFISEGDTVDTSQAAHWTSVATAGNISVEPDSNLVTGTNTTFTTSLATRDIVLFGNNTDLVPYSITDIDTSGTNVTVSVNPGTDVFSVGGRVYIAQTVGSTELNAKYFYINSKTGDAQNGYTLTLYTYAYDEAEEELVQETVLSADVTDWTSGGILRNSPPAARVISIISDTQCLIDRTFREPLTSTSLNRRTYRTDVSADALFATVVWDGTDFTLGKFIFLDPSLNVGKVVLVQPSVTSLIYNAAGTQVTNPETISVTATALGFSDPIFKVSAVTSGFNNDISGGDPSPLDATFQEPDSVGGFTYTKTIDVDGSLDFRDAEEEVVTVQVAERYNTTDAVEGLGTIIKLTEASDGIDGKNVFLASEDYTIIYDESGANPIYNQDDASDVTLTFTATPGNFTNPYYKFTLTLGPGATTETLLASRLGLMLSNQEILLLYKYLQTLVLGAPILFKEAQQLK